MKKTHALGLIAFAVFAFSAMMAASAFAATLQWLEGGKAMTGPQLFQTVKTTEDAITDADGTGLTIIMSCSWIEDGVIGPGLQRTVTEVLSLAAGKITLSSLLSCTNIMSCPSPQAAPADLPWLARLELMGTEAEPLFLDVLENGGQGEPGWELMCEEPLIGLVEDTCTNVATKPIGSNLENDAAENDVLETLVLEEILLCAGTGTETGSISTGAEPGLISLTGGGSLSVSYE
jgi:hypothetical protein